MMQPLPEFETGDIVQPSNHPGQWEVLRQWANGFFVCREIRSGAIYPFNPFLLRKITSREMPVTYSVCEHRLDQGRRNLARLEATLTLEAEREYTPEELAALVEQSERQAIDDQFGQDAFPADVRPVGAAEGHPATA